MQGPAAPRKPLFHLKPAPVKKKPRQGLEIAYTSDQLFRGFCKAGNIDRPDI